MFRNWIKRDIDVHMGTRSSKKQIRKSCKTKREG